MLRRTGGLQPDAIESVVLNVDPGHLKVCNILQPTTGLEVKFSLRAANALALLGENTANDHLYTDATAQRPDVIALRDKISIQPRKAASHTLSEVVVRLRDGSELRQAHDVGIPMADLAAQGRMLRRKFDALAAPVIGEARAADVAERCGDLAGVSDVASLMALVRDPEAVRASGLTDAARAVASGQR